MKIFYMNQGGGGNWGGIPYRDYDLLLIAECSTTKGPEFTSKPIPGNNTPRLAIFERDGRSRIITAITDIDYIAKSIRPILTFTLTGMPPIRIIFMHLKSADPAAANESLDGALNWLGEKIRTETILWVGDFNRANRLLPETWMQFRGGGISRWYLDRAILTGPEIPGVYMWKESKSGDNQHIGIVVEFQGR